MNDPSISDVEGSRRAAGMAGWHASATLEQRRDGWRLMSEQFASDVRALEAACQQHEAALGAPEEARAEVRLRRAFVSPRTRLMQ